MINTKTELYQSLKDSAEIIKSFGVDSIGVFGSFKRNEIKATSDVDFLVEFGSSQKTYSNLFNLHEFLSKLTGRKVEVVTKKGLSKYIGPYILKEVEYVSI